MDMNLDTKELIKKIDELIEVVKVIGEDKIKFNDIANTAQRKKMFRLMTGERSLQDIANTVGVSVEAVRIFVNELDKEGFVFIKEIGKKFYPIKLI